MRPAERTVWYVFFLTWPLAFCTFSYFRIFGFWNFLGEYFWYISFVFAVIAVWMLNSFETFHGFKTSEKIWIRVGVFHAILFWYYICVITVWGLYPLIFK